MSAEGELLSYIQSTKMSDYSLSNLDEGEIEDGELIDEDNSSHSSAPLDKLSERARRFGLHSEPRKSINPRLEKFHRRMGVDSETRTEALHLYGTDNMKTQDVFGYFLKYPPSSIEWITEKTCNAVWLDEESCAEAFKKCSVHIKGQQNSESDDSGKEEESVTMEDIRCALPAGIWRKGHASALAPSLFMRYAKRSDRKGSGSQSTPAVDSFNRGVTFLDEGDEVSKKIRCESSNPWVDIAKQWNNFEKKTNYNVPRLKDARLVLNHRDTNNYRHQDQSRNDPRHREKIIPVSKFVPLRKMQADIEERRVLERTNRTNYKAVNRNSGDLRERLGRKRKLLTEEENEEDEEDYLSEDLEDIKEDVKPCSLRIEFDNTETHSVDKWDDCNSTASSDSDEVQVRSNVGDLRSKLMKLNPSPEKDDKKTCVKSILRIKPVKCRSSSFSPLRIEIDNDNYNPSEDSD